MKAAVLTEPGSPAEALTVQEVEDPKPEPSQVVMRVRACGVCGHDQADRAGLSRPPSLPCVLGHEISGEVVEVGNQVRHARVGDLVATKQFTTCGQCLACRSGMELDCAKKQFNYGGCAEYVAIEDDALLPIPDAVDVVGASIVACAVGTCYQALAHAGELRPGEFVAVAGAGGGLGLHGVQVAAALGGRVIALTTSPHKRDLLERAGAESVLCSADGQFADELLELTGGKGIEVVLDNVGHPAAFSQCFRALRKRGRYVVTGQLYRERISFYPFFLFNKEAILTGSQSTPMSAFIRSMDLVRDGKVNPVYRTFSLDQVAEAHAGMEDRSVVGRAVVVP